jgi:hypothetical protein
MFIVDRWRYTHAVCHLGNINPYVVARNHMRCWKQPGPHTMRIVSLERWLALVNRHKLV